MSEVGSPKSEAVVIVLCSLPVGRQVYFLLFDGGLKPPFGFLCIMRKAVQNRRALCRSNLFARFDEKSAGAGVITPPLRSSPYTKGTPASRQAGLRGLELMLRTSVFRLRTSALYFHRLRGYAVIALGLIPSSFQGLYLHRCGGYIVFAVLIIG